MVVHDPAAYLSLLHSRPAPQYVRGRLLVQTGNVHAYIAQNSTHNELQDQPVLPLLLLLTSPGCTVVQHIIMYQTGCVNHLNDLS